MDEKLSRRLAMALVAAESAADVKAVLADDEAKYYFDNPANWSPYGNREKNWDTVGNQQTNPVGALVELIINGEDAILLRKAKEANISDPRSGHAPRSMFEAVKRFFPQVNEGKIQKLSPAQRTNLAEECIRIGIRRAARSNSRYPSYVVIDSGSGQRPEDFPRTFLSLGEKNKEGIPFVQGKFNMGSTGSLRFCTRSDIRDGHYKLIVSRAQGSEYWGWTLVRVRAPLNGEQLPVAEYFSPGKDIQRFREDQIKAFGHDTLGLVNSGSIVKLYEYDIGDKNHNVDIGLYNALTVNLIDCALPIRVYDFDAKPIEGKGPLRKEGIAARTFSGLSVVLGAELSEEPDETGEFKERGDPDTEWVYQVAQRNDEELGQVRIVATALRRLKDFLRDQPARVFYTINGQTHAFERASFLNQRVGLPDLRNHLLINVVCDDLNKQALATIFMPDRERKASNELSRRLESLVIDELKKDDRLRQFAAEIRMRRAHEQVEDSEATRELLRELVKSDPAIRDLFGLGAFLPTGIGGFGNDGDGQGERSGGTHPFVGKKFPSFLKLLNVREENGVFVKEVPVNLQRRIECGTDAENEYLTRVESPGRAWTSVPPTALPNSVKLHNGVARFTVWAPEGAKPGDEVVAEFGFTDNGPNFEPLKVSVVVRFTEAQKPQKGRPGDKTDTKDAENQGAGHPEFIFVGQEQWADHDFDDDAGAYYAQGDKPRVYVNRDNRYLVNMRVKEKDEATRVTNENTFKMGLGLIALAVFRKASAVVDAEGAPARDADPEGASRQATSAIAPYIVTIIRRLGGAV
ncbi:MAG: hypothetical protein H3C59_08320 [Burkholderiaceae bacterium]|nr:hypothetical protein [Burkholderiaceae bacterium]